MTRPMSPQALADATGDRAAIGATPWPLRPARHLSADDDDAWPLRAARGVLRLLTRFDTLLWGESDTPLLRVLDTLAILSFPLSLALIAVAFLL